MFGAYRTLLAVAVIADHYLPANGAGAIAVFGFYCLSGFLMTLLMTGVYRGRPAAFYINRVLRLYPMYLATVAITLAVGLAIPFVAGISIPTDPFVFARQILYWVRIEDPRIVPTSAAVTNEIAFYILIGLGLSRTLKITAIWLACSVLLVSIIYLRYGAWLLSLYFPVWSASLPFAIGALLAHLRGKIPVLRAEVALLAFIGCAAVTVLLMASAALHQNTEAGLILRLYVSLVPGAAAVAILYRTDLPAWRSVDEQIGQFSYPLYLVQFVAGEMIVAGWFPILAPLGHFMAVLLLTTAIGSICLLVIDVPVQAIRQRIRAGRPLVDRAPVLKKS